MIYKRRYALLITFLFCLLVNAKVLAQIGESAALKPIEKIVSVADKLIANTPFEYRLRPRMPHKSLNKIQFLNFEHNFSTNEPGVAYAISTIQSPKTEKIKFDLSHSGGMKVWINEKEVYNYHHEDKVQVIYGEGGNVHLDTSFVASLKEGVNKTLLKSANEGEDWSFYLKSAKKIEGLELRVDSLSLVHNAMSEVTNWLTAGPFPNSVTEQGKHTGLETIYPPEKEFKTAEVYEYKSNKIVWSIPRIPVKSEGFGHITIWGNTHYSWSYHTAGSAWSMGHLGHYLGEERFLSYSKSFGNFFIDKKPYIVYQKYQEGAMAESADSRIVEGNMLDYTTAPGLVYLYWLKQEPDFEKREQWLEVHEEILDYAMNEQVRLPAGNFTRVTPKKYTTWADDMFMGIPYLLRSAELSADAKLSKTLYDDAVNQFYAFNEQVYDANDNLYRQGQYSEEKVKIPYWSRANGWALWATMELVDKLPTNHPKRKAILKYFRKHVAALASYQNPKSGFWHNLVNRLDSFEETSGTAIFTYCITKGINNGWLNAKKYTPVALKGWKAIESVIDSDGTLHGTCIGTMMSEDEQHYYTRPVEDDDSHGIFAVLLAGMEIDKLLKKNR